MFACNCQSFLIAGETNKITKCGEKKDLQKEVKKTTIISILNPGHKKTTFACKFYHFDEFVCVSFSIIDAKPDQKP